MIELHSNQAVIDRLRNYIGHLQDLNLEHKLQDADPTWMTILLRDYVLNGSLDRIDDELKARLTQRRDSNIYDID